MTRRSIIERVRDMVDAEAPRAAAVEVLVDEFQGPARAWADSLAEVADAVDELADALPAWRDEEDREAKADAREELLSVLGRVVDAYDGLPLLADLIDGLDLLSDPPEQRPRGCKCNPEQYDPHNDPDCPLREAS